MTVAETTPVDPVNLVEAIAQNDIDTRWFIPFVLYRLQASRLENQQVDLELSLINIGDTANESRLLRLTWLETDATLGIPLVQDRVITEWAACGIACILIPRYTDYRVTQVTQVGDGFDYWVGDDVQDFALEVSGTLKGNIRQRHRTKVKQLIESRGQWDGFVSVTSFQDRQTVLSFHSQKEAKGETQ